MLGLPLQLYPETLRIKRCLTKDTNLDTKVGIFSRKNFIVFEKDYFIYNVYWVKILGLALFFVRLLRDPLL
jgi:hypothetical protein